MIEGVFHIDLNELPFEVLRIGGGIGDEEQFGFAADEVDHDGVDAECAFGGKCNLRLVDETKRASACLFHIYTRIRCEYLVIIFVRNVRILMGAFKVHIAEDGMVEIFVELCKRWESMFRFLDESE